MTTFNEAYYRFNMKYGKEDSPIHLNSKEEDLQLAKRLLKEYQEKCDQKNIEICERNIKNFSR